MRGSSGVIAPAGLTFGAADERAMERGFAASYDRRSQLNVGVRQTTRIAHPTAMRPLLSRIALILLATSACKAERSGDERDLTLLPSDSAAGVPRTRSLPSRPDCVSQAPQHVSLRGTVQREVRLGPPGYGETPARDRRDTILVLVAARAVPVCSDPEIDSEAPAIIRAGRLQLVGRLDPRRYAVGDTVVVYGRFGQASYGWHYTPVVLYVDSIPAGRSSPRSGKRSSASGSVAPVA
jgi:hypothetical protein